ncbi:condensation domain superfamily domain-containing protein [Histoplasma capsulatum G186AR]|nr:condensation domain superfamily domain-containing protein [Histoplasma capsulatum]QSS72396.1 condensation domain superfamily domain-containing protein [Histoplasma capsulatum G186AR]
MEMAFQTEDCAVTRLEKLRPVGLLERYSSARHHLGFYINVAVTATYTLPRCSQPLKNYIYKACKILIGQHPILSAIPVGEDTDEPHFIRVPTINLDNSVLFKDRQRGSHGSNSPLCPNPDMDLEELLNIQHNMPFSFPSPFWRLYILTDPNHPHLFTASFIFHHAIGDGTSGMAFHKTFLHALHLALSSSPSSSEVESTITAPNIPLLPSLEALHPIPVSIPFLFSILFKEKIWNKQDPCLWTGSKITMPLQSEIRHLVLSESETTSFRDLCRKNKTTITAALHTLVAGALFVNLSAHYTQLRCVGALSNRRWLGCRICDDSMGVFVQAFQDSYRREGFFDQSGNFKFPWDEAVRSRKTIEDTINMQGKNAISNLLKYVGDYHSELFLSKIGKNRADSYEVSNLGVFGSNLEATVGSQKPLVGRMVFSQSANVTGSAFEVSAITGGDGCLVLTFSWQKGVVDLHLVSNIMKTIVEHLGTII